MKKRIITTLTLSGMFLVGGACGIGSGGANNQTVEFRTQDKIASNFNNVQPIPVFPYSQLRQNLKELEKAQAEGVQTTSFFYNFGSNTPIKSCPSIGSPIPTTDSLTNPQQPLRDNSQPLNNGGGNVVVDQMEPTGIYPGHSTGTYVMCVGGDGTVRPSYWEGFVETEFATGATVKNGVITDVGTTSFNFSKDKRSAGVK